MTRALMLYVPISRDLRDARLRVLGDDLARKQVAKRAEAWQLAFRRWYRPPIKVFNTEE